MGAVTDQKANTSLTELYLNGSRVGDAGAAALADALQATVWTCKKCVFSSVSPQMLLHRVVCTVGVVNFFGSTRSGFLCYLSCVLPEKAHSGYVAPCENRVALFDFLTEEM